MEAQRGWKKEKETVGDKENKEMGNWRGKYGTDGTNKWGGGGVNVKQRDNKKQKNKYSSSASLLKLCPINGNLRQLIRSLI